MGAPNHNDYSTYFTPTVQRVEVEGTSISADTTVDKFGTDRVSGVWIYIEIGTVTGTSPTLDIKLRAVIPTGGATDPYATSQAIQIMALTQATAAVKLAAGFVSAGNGNFADATAALAAASAKTVPLPAFCDILLDVGGTSPVFPITKFRVILSR